MNYPKWGKQNQKNTAGGNTVPSAGTEASAEPAKKQQQENSRQSHMGAAVLVLVIALIGAIIGNVTGAMHRLLPLQDDDFNTDGHFSLILSADSVLLHVGQPQEIRFTVRISSDLLELGHGSEVSIIDQNGDELAIVPIDYSYQTDSYAEYRYSLLCTPQDSSGMTCYAKLGKLRSEPLDFYTLDRLTVSDLAVSLEIGSALTEWLETEQSEERYLNDEITADELLQRVAGYLRADSRIDCVEINAENVFYTTVNHVAGIYALPADEYYFSGASAAPVTESGDFTMEGNASDTFEDEVTSGSLSSGNNASLYFDGINSITNTSFAVLNPASGMDDPLIGKAISIYNAMAESYAQALNYTTVNIDGSAVLDSLLSGTLQNYGIIALTSHGSYASFPSGYRNYYWGNHVLSGDTDAAEESFAFFPDVRGIDDSTGLTDYCYCSGDFSRSLFLISSNGQLVISSNVIRAAYQNRYFDNSIVFFGSCYGLLDERTVPFLLNHGAKAVIGWKSLVPASVQEAAFNGIFRELRLNPSVGTKSISTLSGSLTPGMGELISSISRNFWAVHDSFVNWLFSRSESGSELASTGSRAYICYTNSAFRLVQYGSVTGQVDVVTTLVEEGIDGTVTKTEVVRPGSGVSLQFHRYENGTFLSEACTETEADETGTFRIGKLRWGVYGIRLTGEAIPTSYASFTLADKDFTGIRHLRVVPDTASFSRAVHYAADTAVSGADPQWLKDHTEPAAGASVSLTLIEAGSESNAILNGTIYRTNTDSSGLFTVEGIPGGIYTLQITDGKTPARSCTVSLLRLESGTSVTSEIPYYLSSEAK